MYQGGQLIRRAGEPAAASPMLTGRPITTTTPPTSTPAPANTGDVYQNGQLVRRQGEPVWVNRLETIPSTASMAISPQQKGGAFSPAPPTSSAYAGEIITAAGQRISTAFPEKYPGATQVWREPTTSELAAKSGIEAFAVSHPAYFVEPAGTFAKPSPMNYADYWSQQAIVKVQKETGEIYGSQMIQTSLNINKPFSMDIAQKEQGIAQSGTIKESSKQRYGVYDSGYIPTITIPPKGNPYFETIYGGTYQLESKLGGIVGLGAAAFATGIVLSPFSTGRNLGQSAIETIQDPLGAPSRFIQGIASTPSYVITTAQETLGGSIPAARRAGEFTGGLIVTDIAGGAIIKATKGATFIGKTRIPTQEIFDPQAISKLEEGKVSYPQSPGGTTQMLSRFAKGSEKAQSYFPGTNTIVVHATAENISKNLSVETGASETPGLYVAPYGRGSPAFLRIGGEQRPIIGLKLNPFTSPSGLLIDLEKPVSSIPIEYTSSYEVAQKFFGKGEQPVIAEPGVAYISPAATIGRKFETEAIITKGTNLEKKSYKYYTEVLGEKVALPEYIAVRTVEKVPRIGAKIEPIEKISVKSSRSLRESFSRPMIEINPIRMLSDISVSRVEKVSSTPIYSYSKSTSKGISINGISGVSGIKSNMGKTLSISKLSISAPSLSIGTIESGIKSTLRAITPNKPSYPGPSKYNPSPSISLPKSSPSRHIPYLPPPSISNLPKKMLRSPFGTSKRKLTPTIGKIVVKSSEFRKFFSGETDITRVVRGPKITRAYAQAFARSGVAISFPTAQEYLAATHRKNNKSYRQKYLERRAKNKRR
jgi:hypothetical protein